MLWNGNYSFLFKWTKLKYETLGSVFIKSFSFILFFIITPITSLSYYYCSKYIYINLLVSIIFNFNFIFQQIIFLLEQYWVFLKNILLTAFITTFYIIYYVLYTKFNFNELTKFALLYYIKLTALPILNIIFLYYWKLEMKCFLNVLNVIFNIIISPVLINQLELYFCYLLPFSAFLTIYKFFFRKKIIFVSIIMLKIDISRNFCYNLINIKKGYKDAGYIIYKKKTIIYAKR